MTNEVLKIIGEHPNKLQLAINAFKYAAGYLIDKNRSSIREGMVDSPTDDCWQGVCGCVYDYLQASDDENKGVTEVWLFHLSEAFFVQKFNRNVMMTYWWDTHAPGCLDVRREFCEYIVKELVQYQNF